MEVDVETGARLGLYPESIAVRVYEVAERARDIATDALDAGKLTEALRAGDAELRALAAMAGLGVRDEARVVEYDAFRVTAHAVIRAARRDPAVAEAVAAQLDVVDEGGIAADIRAQFKRLNAESSSQQLSSVSQKPSRETSVRRFGTLAAAGWAVEGAEEVVDFHVEGFSDPEPGVE